MKRMDFATDVTAALRPLGLETRALDARHLPAVAQRLDEALAPGRLPPEATAWIRRTVSASLPSDTRPLSVMVVAQALPFTGALLSRRGVEWRVTVPPHYAGYKENWLAQGAALTEAMRPWGYRAVKADLPSKTLAAVTGLARYGRNNLAYVPGMGSYLALGSFVSDAPVDAAEPLTPLALDRCGDCTACLKACPTGAIAEDRFQIHADRCLTMHNESEGEWPSWIRSEWHTSAVGCATCQRCCPENRTYERWAPLERFDEQETELLLSGVPVEELADDLRARLFRSGLLYAYRLLPRNLRALLT